MPMPGSKVSGCMQTPTTTIRDISGACSINCRITPGTPTHSNTTGRFGFRLSYPRGNRDGYQYEPWHWCFQQPCES